MRVRSLCVAVFSRSISSGEEAAASAAVPSAVGRGVVVAAAGSAVVGVVPVIVPIVVVAVTVATPSGPTAVAGPAVVVVVVVAVGAQVVEVEEPRVDVIGADRAVSRYREVSSGTITPSGAVVIKGDVLSLYAAVELIHDQ